MNRYLAAGLLASLAVLLAIVAAVPSTDDFSPDNPGYNGLTAFVQRYNATVIPAADAARLGPGTALFLIGPDRPPTPQEAQALRQYVEQGGLLVVADDFGAGNALLQALGVGARLAGAPIADPLYMYKNPALPIATARLGGRTYTLYLNYPTYVEAGGPCLAYTSVFSYADLDGDGQKEAGEPGGPLCVAYMQPLGQGQVYVVADSSLWINAMLPLGDNAAFADALARGRAVYLAGDMWKVGNYAQARRQVLGALSLLVGTSVKYPLLAALSVALYAAARRIYTRTPRRPQPDPEEVAARHPEWDRELLRRLAEELHAR